MQGCRGLFFYVNKISNKSRREIIHKLELKEHPAIQSSEAPQLTDSNKYHSSTAFGLQVSIHTPGPALMIIYK